MSTDEILALASTPEEKCFREKLESKFVAEDSFLEYYEEIEEEGAYPDLLGKSVQVSATQFKEIYNTIAAVSEFLDVPRPECFIYEGFEYEVELQGIKRPRILISSRVVDEFKPDELLHLISKEVFHIRSGHTKYFVLTEKMLELMETIPEIPGLNLIKQFGGGTAFDAMSFNLKSVAFSWYKHVCFTGDNFALAYCGNLRSSANAILLDVLGGRKLAEGVDFSSFIQSASEIQNCIGPAATLERVNEDSPYAPERILNLFRYVNTENCKKLALVCSEERRS